MADSLKQFNAPTAPREASASAACLTGAQPADVPLVEMDLVALCQQLKQDPAWHTSDRRALPLLKSSGMRIVLMGLRAGAELKTHTAPGSISVQALEGRIGFHTAQQEVQLTPGQLLALQAGIPHSVTAHEDSLFLLTVSL